MKNTFRALLASASIAVLFGAAIPAAASDSEPMHVSVPFAFKAGKTMLPAGDYAVYSADSNVIMIKGLGGNAILLGAPGADAVIDKAGISFERDGDNYCLKSVHAWGKTSSTRLAGASGAEEK